MKSRRTPILTTRWTVPTARHLRRRPKLGMVKRIVFLSVPQFGTNIADWVRTYTIGRQVVVSKLRASVEASQLPLLDRFEGCLSSFAARATNLDLLEAVQRS